MSRHSRHRRSRATKWGGPVIVALMMGGLAFAVSDQGTALFGSPHAPVPTSTTPLMTEPISVSSVRFEVAIRRPEADRDLRLIVDTASEAATPITVDKGWRAEHLVHEQALKLVSSEERGFRLTDGAEWNITLRDAHGEAYMQPRLIGLADDRHAIVVATIDQTSILNVARSGNISPIGTVPENGIVHGLSGGSLWLSTFTPGEGIEMPASGPSRLYRVSLTGEREAVASSETEVFAGVISNGERIAYWTERGEFTTVGSDGFSGPGLPLLWLEDALIVSDGPRLMRYEASGKKVDTGVTLDGSAVTAKPLE